MKHAANITQQFENVLIRLYVVLRRVSKHNQLKREYLFLNLWFKTNENAFLICFFLFLPIAS